jgi:hypothetical protein
MEIWYRRELFRRAEAKVITKSDRDNAVQRHAIHREWFLSTVMNVHSQNAVMIVPIETFPQDTVMSLHVSIIHCYVARLDNNNF